MTRRYGPDSDSREPEPEWRMPLIDPSPSKPFFTSVSKESAMRQTFNFDDPNDPVWDWRPWFAWHPVRLLTMEWAWLRWVERRPACSGGWSCGGWDYSWPMPGRESAVGTGSLVGGRFTGDPNAIRRGNHP